MINNLIIARDAFHAMLQEIAAYPGVETGGLLIGYSNNIRHSSNVVFATGGGPNSQRATHTFERDPEYAQAQLDNYVTVTEGEADYLGEWHRHITRSAWLSQPDIDAMRAIATTPEYNTPNPIFVVVGMPGDDQTQRNVKAFAWNDGEVLELEVTLAE